ncbi:hypothetical protein CRM22_005799 [Opisthorchis felineus]|uniref:Ectonucleoside triphosphate diphosphohydrolase 1 n=1 Tax=Opisthorchis felineus TaxID=147828 RepID=A0A4V3SER1_OPIFE|nr:hypothetical protein CRM22_005799 [Opisthorchis felineus]TGZ65574.1 hypothetical protein CRM22_005799 [Opisthorchis felineus]
MECSTSTRRGLIIGAAVVIAISAVALIIIAVLYALASNVGLMHAVVLDAGSTSTKLNLYEWVDDPFRTNAQVKQIADSRVKPGISSYVEQPFEAYKQLQVPLQTLVANLSEEERRKTPVYLAATAGMRLKLLEDPLGSLDLFDKIRRGLLTSGLLVEVPNERIRMLSGSEEGLFGWISVNNILNLITTDVQVPPDKTVGSLDLGGASTQIAFTPSSIPTTMEKTAYMFPLKLFGGQYDVYSHSFLCYGKNEIERRIMGAAIGTSQGTEIQHPCLLSGYMSGEMDPNKIFSGPCMSGSYANKVFGKEYTKPLKLDKFKFRGTGDLSACKKLISEQFKKDICTTSPCSFNNVYQPPVVGDFRAYAGFSYVTKYLFPGQPTGISKTQFDKSVENFCTQPWATVESKTPVEERESVAKYCFDGVFVSALLENYGFTKDEEWKRITFGDKIEGTTVSWALGYMLDQSGFLPSESPPINMPVTLFAGLAALLAALLIVAVVMLALALCGCIKAGERFE